MDVISERPELAAGCGRIGFKLESRGFGGTEAADSVAIRARKGLIALGEIQPAPQAIAEAQAQETDQVALVVRLAIVLAQIVD